ncbi:hypothetical protein M8818_000085 [Zalaria obscura]|uniref:Uncharacterized protein n=1 Tax=Zalaria obscura TaxID=2024903 RepID=A0ACC3SPF8_9PEZI
MLRAVVRGTGLDPKRFPLQTLPELAEKCPESMKLIDHFRALWHPAGLCRAAAPWRFRTMQLEYLVVLGSLHPTRPRNPKVPLARACIISDLIYRTDLSLAEENTAEPEKTRIAGSTTYTYAPMPVGASA